MKKTLLLLLVITCTLGCKQTKQQQQSTEDPFAYFNAKDRAAESAQIVDTIFLGLRFGMSKQEVDDFTSQLHQQGKLIPSGIGGYWYIMNTEKTKIKCLLQTKYFHDKLYNLQLSFMEWSSALTDYDFIRMNFDDDTSDKLLKEAKELFLQSAKSKNIFYDKYSEFPLDTIDYTLFVRDNLIVEFWPGGIIHYINAPVEKQMNEEKKGNGADIKKSISDF